MVLYKIITSVCAKCRAGTPPGFFTERGGVGRVEALILRLYINCVGF
jgi:hypothetical protein